MTLDEAIKHAEEVAEEKEKYIKRIYETLPAEERFLFSEEKNGCKKCANEHRQLAEWLKELKKLKEQDSCEDTISRQAVINAIANTCFWLSASDWNELTECINSISPTKPQPKIGHWIVQAIYNCHTEFKCSECGYVHDFMHLYGEPTADYTYCPNCGCKMKGSED